MKKFYRQFVFPALAGFAFLTAASLAFAQEGDTILEKAAEIPWLFNLLWPIISTAIVSVIRAVAGTAKDKVPPAFWPLLNTGIAAVLAAVQATDNPAQLVGNIVTAVLNAFGLNKTLDLTKGKASTVTPADKKKLVALKEAA